MLKYAKPYTGMFLIGVLGSILFAASNASLAYLVRRFMHGTFLDKSHDILWEVPIGVVVTTPALWLNPALSGVWASFMTTLALCLSAYLLMEAAATHDVLGKLRHELLKEETFAVVARKTVQSA